MFQTFSSTFPFKLKNFTFSSPSLLNVLPQTGKNQSSIDETHLVKIPSQIFSSLFCSLDALLETISTLFPLSAKLSAIFKTCVEPPTKSSV